MAFTVNWGEVLKTAGPALASMAQGKASNRGFETNTNITTARDAELAAQARARANVEAGTLDVARQREAREGAAQAFKQAQIAALMKNMQDVNFANVGNFRTKVPEMHFSGGSRPSAFGLEGKQLADIMQNRSLQTLTAPPGGAGGTGSQAVPRDGGVMPAYQGAEVPEEGFWEKALGIAGLGATVAGSMPGLFGQGAAPSVAANVAKNPMGGAGTQSFGGANFGGAAAAGAAGAAGAAAPRLAGLTAAQLFPSSAAPALTSSFKPGVSFMGNAAGGAAPLKGVSFMPGAAGAASTAGAGAKGGSNALMRMLGSSTGGMTGAMGALNAAAGPAGMAAGIIAPYLPAGKAREAANYASKGAMIGSFFPGPGTAIGAGVGAAVGAVKGHQNATKPAREKLAKTLGYGTLANLNKALEGMGPEGQRLLDQGLHVIGKHDTKGNDAWIQQVATLLGRR